MQGWLLRSKLNGTLTRVQTVDSCFDLVGYRQHGVASIAVMGWSTTYKPLFIHDKNIKASKLVGSCTNKIHKKNYN